MFSVFISVAKNLLLFGKDLTAGSMDLRRYRPVKLPENLRSINRPERSLDGVLEFGEAKWLR
jgi:hypothetical protein